MVRGWRPRLHGFAVLAEGPGLVAGHLSAHTRKQPFADDWRLVAQINDSSESVMANIAEGFGRGTQGEFVTFLGYALGSLDETRSHLVAAYDRGYLEKDDYAALFREGLAIRKLLLRFSRSMTMHGSGAKNIRKVKPWAEVVAEWYERTTGRSRFEYQKRGDGTPMNQPPEKG